MYGDALETPWESSVLKIGSKASKLFLSPQRGFCSYTRQKFHSSVPHRGWQGGRLQRCVCLRQPCLRGPPLSGRLSHPQNGSIIQSQTPIHTTLTQLTRPDTWQEGPEDLGTVSWLVKQILEHALSTFSPQKTTNLSFSFLFYSFTITTGPICSRLMLHKK